YYSRVHAEEYAFHGDPAIKLNASALPDYVVEAPGITIDPAFMSVADTTFTVKVRVNNIGKATNDSVTFRLNRTFPNGSTTTVLIKKFAKLFLEDSVSVQVPIVSNRDKGSNVLTATLDYNNEVNEVVKYNNSASKTIDISEDEIRPIYPYKYAVINQPVIKLAASTVNPFSPARNYIMEIDTTELFNSPLKISKTNYSSGGVIEFDAGFSFVENRTYYWRVAPSGLSSPHWNISSFVYRSGAVPAFEQNHLYQKLNSQLTGLSFDSTKRKYSFLKKAHNLFITNSIYPTSGTEDNHFSISVDGSTSIQSACLGSSIIVNVFDSLTFEPWKNTTNPFGAAPTCKPTRQYNFEYSYRSADTRKNAVEFLNTVPNGSFVAVRLVLDAPHNVFAADWAQDSAVYGTSFSLYHRLKSSGFTDIDSFNRPRTWAFVFKKGDAGFTPQSDFSEGEYDRLTLSVDAITSGTRGTITSPKFGPAKSWSKVVWNGYSEEVGSDVPTVDVIGISADNTERVLFTVDNTNHDFNISSVSAAQYPFIKLRLNNKDTLTATPYQLTSWRVDYDPVPEGGLAPNMHFSMPEYHNGIVGSPDSLRFSVAFKNVSKVNFDRLNVKLVLIDTMGVSRTYPLPQTRLIPAGDTVHVAVAINASDLSGVYNVYLQANPNNLTTEQHSFNNFFYRTININNARLLPVTLLDFNAVLQGNDVRTAWSITEETNVKEYVVEHSRNGSNYNKIGTVTATNGQGIRNYTFVHPNVSEGKNFYRLLINDKDGASKFSSVRLVTVGKSLIVNVYPNPVKDKLNVSLNSSGSKPANLKLINTFGQVVHQQQLSGTVQIDMTKYAAGMYVLQIDDGLNISTFKVQKQ
ncbi:MAG TPA: T9SS type A sorting domain-containing protein, partial [Segetibacter sp.]